MMKKVLIGFAAFFALAVVFNMVMPKPEVKPKPEEPAAKVVELAPPPSAATEAVDVLKAAHALPESNSVKAFQVDGAVAAVNVAWARVDGFNLVVYETPEQRNQARLLLADACKPYARPVEGCNVLAECGPFLLYAPTSENGRDTYGAAQKLRNTWRELNDGMQSKLQEFRTILAKHYACE